MAKKDEFDFGEGDLDDLDFGGLDFGDDGDPFGQTKDDRKPVEHFKEAVKNTAKSKLTDTSFFRRVLSKALPKGYVQAMDAYDALDSSIASIMKDNQSELNPYLVQMKRKFDVMSPAIRRVIPKSLREAADMASDNNSSSYTQEDELSLNIKGLDGLFASQAQDREQATFREAVKDTREQKRFKAEMTVNLAAAKGIGRLVGYQDTILINYHRKHLELTYRQLDVGIRGLQASSEFYAEAKSLLKSITKNTGLPDFVKMRTTEVIEQQMKQKLAGAAMKGAGGYAQKFFKGITQNASEMLGQGLEFNAQLNSAEDFGRTKAQMAGSILGNMVGDQIGEWGEQLVGAAMDKLKPIIGKNKFIRKGDNFLRKNLTGIPQRVNDWAKSDTDYDSKWGLGIAGAKALFDTHNATTSISGRSIDDLDNAAKFDDLFHKTVTQILPAQLASIDRWVKTIATGQDQEETAWSHYTDSLVKRSTLGQQHIKMALKDNSDGVRSSVDGILTEMDANELTPEARRALRRQLMHDLADANDFKPEKYVKQDTWSKIDPSVANEIIDLFADKFKIDKVSGQHSRGDDDNDFFNNVRDKYTDVQKYIPDVGSRMDVLSSVVGRRTWRELGLSGFDGSNGDRLNLDSIYDLFVNSGEEKELKKKDKTNETATERAKRLFKEERERKLKEQGIVDVEDDRDLKGKFGPGPNPYNPPTPPVPPGGPTPPPAPVDVKVDFPDLMKTSDEETHKRLDQLIEHQYLGVEYLDLIATLIQAMPSNAGGGGDGEGEGGGPAPGPGGGGGPRTFKLGGILGAAAKGAWKTGKFAAKGLKNYFKFAYGTMWKGTKFGAKLGFAAAKLPFARIDGFGASDIHVMGDPEPSLTAKGIRNGWYFDVNTQKIIEKIADITGPVKNREGDFVITQEEFDKGLYTGKGQSLAGVLGRGAVKGVGLAAKGLKAYFGFTYGTMWKVGKKLTEMAVDQFTQFDAYFPGDEEPRIRSKLMKKGYYRDKDGKPIMTLKEITGPVFDIDNNEIISQEEIDKYKSFYTRNGSLLFTIGRGFAHVGKEGLKLAAKAALAYGKFVGKVYKGMWKVGSGMVKGIGRFISGKARKGAVGSMDQEMAEAAFEVHVEQLKIQTSIYELLQKKFDPERVHGDVDGDGVREYSWQDILRRRKEKAAAAGATAGTGGPNEEVVEAIHELNKNLEHKLDDLADVTEEAGKSSLLEDAADLSEIKGEGKGRGRGRGPKPRRGFRSGRGIRGTIGKIGGAAWRATKGVGRFALGAGRMAMGVGGWAARGAIAAAPMLASGAMAVGSAALSAAGAVGSAVLGALSMPLVLGAVVLGGAAYLGYRWYKSSQAKKFPLLYLRMTQYGVDPTNQARVEKLLQLEALCSKAVTIDPSGSASLDPEKVDINAFLQLFSANDQKAQNNLLKWVQARFRPVFIAHCVAMNKIRGSMDLSSADSGIGDGDIDTFLTTVDIGGMQDVYNDEDTSPFDSDLDTDADDVVAAIKMVRERREDKKKDQASTAANAAAVGSAAGVAAATTLSVAKNGTDPSEIAKGIKVATPMLGGAAAYQQRAAAAANAKLKSLDIPTAVRFKTYGLKELQLDKCEQLQKVEEVYWDHITYSGTEKAMVEGNSDELKAAVFDIFKPADDPARADLERWITYRFMPVFLQYAISCRRRYNGAAKDAARNLPGPSMKEVLEETTSAKTETMFTTTSVWSIANSPWKGYELESLSGSVKLYIDGLDKGDSSKVLDVPGLEAQKRSESKNTEFGNRMTNIALGNTQGNGNQGNIGQTGPTLANYGKIYGSGAVAGGVAGQSTTGKGDGSLLMSGTMGTAVAHPGGGSGGDINSIPEPQDNSKTSMKSVIEAAAGMVGFDPRIAVNVAGTESGLDPTADNGMAAGLFQFVGGTWSDMLRKYGPTYGISANASRKDPRANAILGVCYLKENYEGLKSSLGGEVTDLHLYMSHFLGLGGAKRFLSAPRNDPSYMHVGNGSPTPSRQKGDGGNIVLWPNKSIFYEDYKSDNPQRIRTVQGVLVEMQKRMNIGLKKAGLSGSAGSNEIDAAGVPNGSASGSGGSSAGGGGSPSPAGNEDPGAMVAAAAAAAPAAAAGGASGTPSSSTTPSGPAPSTPMPMKVAQEINSDPGPSVDSQLAPSAPMIPGPSASEASASQTQKSNRAADAAVDTSLQDIMQKMYEVDVESNKVLNAILNKLDNLGTGGQQGQQPQQKAAPTPEPIRRNPVDVSRKQAIT